VFLLAWSAHEEQQRGGLDSIAQGQTITQGNTCMQVPLGVKMFDISCFRSTLLAIVSATISFVLARNSCMLKARIGLVRLQ
jgi:hypothetical protein